jgi:rhodanese-related sulfurtransferase
MLSFLKSLFKKKESDEVIKQYIDDGAFLVDVRTVTEYKTGSADGAVNIPLNSIINHIDQFKNRETIIVFCRSGSRSSLAKGILTRRGFTKVINGGTWERIQKIIKK